MSKPDFSRQEFIDAAVIVSRVLAESFYDSLHISRQITLEPTAPAEQDICTRTEAAELLKVSTSTVDRMKKTGALPAVKELLPIVRFRKSDLRHFIQKRR
jgi:excisionase family DNA binding protein